MQRFLPLARLSSGSAALAALAPACLLAGCLGTVSVGGGGANVSIGPSGIAASVSRGGVRVAVGGGAGREVVARAPDTRAPVPRGAHGLMRKPLDGGRLTSGFGEQRGGGTRTHKGVDYVAPAGTAVYAAGDGVVEHAGGSRSYGNHVRIAHGGGTTTTYAHLSAFAPGLRTGTRVTRGQRIGAVGSTGRSTTPHLHYEVAIDGTRVDPLGVSP